MRILELSLRSYRVFEEVDLELPARVIGIFGANGSGKSTLVESILWGLYGRARTGKQQIRTHGVLTDCQVRMLFEHGGQQYEVRRTIRGRGHATDAELYVGGLQLAAGVSSVDEEIRRLLRMEQQVFRASVFAEQKQLDAFSDVTAGKRKEMVLRLLGIRPVDDARSVARRQARATKQSADRLLGAVPDLAALEASLKERRDAAKEARARHREATARLREAEARGKAAHRSFDEADRARQRAEKITALRQELAAQREDLTAQHDELGERLEALATELEELPALEEELRSLEGIGDRLHAAERLAEERARLELLEARLGGLVGGDVEPVVAEAVEAEREATSAHRSAAEARAGRQREQELLAEAEERLARAAEADPSQPCPTCGRELGRDFAAYVRHCREEVAATKRRLAAASKTVREAEARARAGEAHLAKARKAAEEARRSDEERGRLSRDVDALRATVGELGAPFGEEEPDLDRLRSGAGRERQLTGRVGALSQQRARREEVERDLTKLKDRLSSLGTRIAALDDEARELAFDPAAHERLARERDEAARALERVRGEERDAADAVATARLEVRELEGQLRQARETAARVEELRSEARYVERVAMLLDGFRDHLVSRIGPELSREAETIFRELTNHEYDDLKIDEEDLTIRIADGDAYFGVERFSGSEADLANLALRVAISTHLSRVSGADIGLLVLDEVLGALDVERKDLFVQTMGRLADRFHQLFVITHAEQVKDQFPVSIDVRKVGRRRSQAVLI